MEAVPELGFERAGTFPGAEVEPPEKRTGLLVDFVLDGVRVHRNLHHHIEIVGQRVPRCHFL